MRIGVDIMGGDYIPKAPIEGALLAQQQLGQEFQLVLIGDQEVILPELERQGANPDQFEIVHTDQYITSEDSPARSLGAKPRASILVGIQLLKEKYIQGFVSAGNTGALLVASIMGLGKIKGVHRPTIAVIFPSLNGKPTLLCDVGANIDSKPEALLDFGILGKIYLESVWKVERPRVALMNIGEEPNKGPQTVRAAYQMMEASDQLNFIGNIEGRDIYEGKTDVIVADGYAGNIILKFAESLYGIFKDRIVGDGFIENFNFERYGGVPILGVEGIALIGHGISPGSAIAQMVETAAEAVRNDLVDKIRIAFESMNKGT